MKKLLLVLFAILVSVSSCAAQTQYTDDSFIDGWQLEFWQLKPLTGDYLIVFTGDTMSIEFDQALKTVPLSSQPQWGIGDTTGYKNIIYIEKSKFRRLAIMDTIITYAIFKSISLLPGSYSLIIRTKGINGQYSRHSKPYWFNVVNVPPMMPVEIKLFIKR